MVEEPTINNILEPQPEPETTKQFYNTEDIISTYTADEETNTNAEEEDDNIANATDSEQEQ